MLKPSLLIFWNMLEFQPCSKEFQRCECELNYHTFVTWIFEPNRSIFGRLDWHIERDQRNMRMKNVCKTPTWIPTWHRMDQKEKEKKNKRLYIVPTWMWARYRNAFPNKSWYSIRGYASFRRWALLVESWYFIPNLGGVQWWFVYCQVSFCWVRDMLDN